MSETGPLRSLHTKHISTDILWVQKGWMLKNYKCSLPAEPFCIFSNFPFSLELFEYSIPLEKVGCNYTFYFKSHNRAYIWSLSKRDATLYYSLYPARISESCTLRKDFRKCVVNKVRHFQDYKLQQFSEDHYGIYYYRQHDSMGKEYSPLCYIDVRLSQQTAYVYPLNIGRIEEKWIIRSLCEDLDIQIGDTRITRYLFYKYEHAGYKGNTVMVGETSIKSPQKHRFTADSFMNFSFGNSIYQHGFLLLPKEGYIIWLDDLLQDQKLSNLYCWVTPEPSHLGVHIMSCTQLSDRGGSAEASHVNTDWYKFTFITGRGEYPDESASQYLGEVQSTQNNVGLGEYASKYLGEVRIVKSRKQYEIPLSEEEES